MRDDNANIGFSIMAIGGVLILAAALYDKYNEPEPPAPPVANPGSGAMFEPFVFFDKETGCEYLSTHLSSSLTPRLAADGKTQKGCRAAAAPPEGKDKS